MRVTTKAGGRAGLFILRVFAAKPFIPLHKTKSVEPAISRNIGPLRFVVGAGNENT
jgi:hypothetical protein